MLRPRLAPDAGVVVGNQTLCSVSTPIFRALLVNNACELPRYLNLSTQTEGPKDRRTKEAIEPEVINSKPINCYLMISSNVPK
jgi:hypothetical protein